MDVQELVESLQNTSGGNVVVKVGDQYFHVQTAYDWSDAVCLSLGASFNPLEGGGTSPSGVNTERTEPTQVPSAEPVEDNSQPNLT